jgi:hypothetical protein
MKPACSAQTLNDCLGTCNAAAAKCPTEANAVNACIPTTTVSCASDGLAQSDGCDAEFKALSACLSGDKGAGPAAATCTPHRASNDDTCTGDCPASAYVVTAGNTYVWCTVKCTSDATCDAASGKPGVFGCDGAACRARCGDASDCGAISGATGCGGGFCY